MPEERTAEEKYHLSLKGPGLAINKVIDSRTAGAIAQMTFGGVGGGGQTDEGQTSGSNSASGSSGRPVALREYLQSVAPERGIHMKILAVARYMRDIENQNDFTRDDVRGRFRSAGEKQPANFHRDFQKAVRSGWIAEDHQSRDRFYVTRSGDEEISRRQT